MTVELPQTVAKAPKTSRGEKTRNRILDAAAEEFGQRGFHEAAVSGITQRAGVALGSFYTYFNSKEELYRALVSHMGEITRRWLSERTAGAPDRLTAERRGIEAFIEFVRTHKSLYRIVMESQFVAPDAYRAYYDVFAEAYRRGLQAASRTGEIAPGHDEERAWALIGMSVFLGLRYGVWDDKRPAAEVAEAVSGLIEHGLAPQTKRALGSEDLTVMFGPLPDLAAKAAELRPGKLALEEIVTGRAVTYAELDRRASQAAGLLAGEGVGPGDRVGLLCRNRIEFFELLFAAGKLGAILVPLNWRMPAEELRGLVEDCEPRMLLYGAEEADAARALGGEGLPLVGLDEDYAARRDTADAHPGREWWPAEDAWYLLYTSGTTGAPKGVIQTYAMAWVNYVNIGQAIGLTERDVTVAFLPLFHAGGIGLHAVPTLIAGGTVKVLPGFDVDAVVELIAGGGLDTFFGVPAVYRELCAHTRFDALDLTRVRHWGSGGAALPTAFVERFAEKGVALCSGMGMTETGPTAFLMDPANAAEKLGSVGKPQILIRARVLGADGREAAPGEVGPLQFAGPGVTPGYWKKPEATREAFTADGWLITGDLARRDADGYFWIAGRTKEMFISGGENVYPAEIENVLCDHPGVAEVCVLGAPDETWGEVGRAFVVAKPGAVLDEAGLRAFCRARLAGYKVPKSFAVVEDLPRNALGKVQKHLLLQPDHAL